MAVSKKKYNLEQIIAEFEKKQENLIKTTMRQIMILLDGKATELAFLYAKRRLISNRFLPKDIRNTIERISNTINARMKDILINSIRISFIQSEEKNNIIETQVAGNGRRVPPGKKLKVVPAAGGNKKGTITSVDEYVKRKKNGLGLSKRIWKVSPSFKKTVNDVMLEGLSKGTAARTLAQDIRKALRNNEYTDHPGKGIYKSPQKNAERVTRSEINLAYANADYERWQRVESIIGIEVKLSNRHEVFDICDDMKGVYPKDFHFVKWHPNCYDQETEVYTLDGWKLFKDVLLGEMVMTLNPGTKNIEWHPCVAKIQSPYSGKMIHYSNRNFDLLVTPDHPMFIMEQNGSFSNNRTAKDFKQGRGWFYRSSEYEGMDIITKTIGGGSFSFDDYCQFMGYYLSDGSIAQNRQQISIAQIIDNDIINRAKIWKLLERMPFKWYETKNGFMCHDKGLYKFLLQFGKSADKFIPQDIMNASKRQIEIFYDSFLSCDGHIKEPKEFTGNRGGKFTSTRSEQEVYTTSVVMAGQLGELILKMGGRPSFKVDRIAGRQQVFRNGIYTINKDMIRIRRCYSETCTVFNTTQVDYSGIVYDIQVEKNHTLYVRRSGKCTWGSNCLCIAIPILASQDVRNQIMDYKLGLTDTPPKIPYIKELPDKAIAWMEKNADRVNGWANRPYWLDANEKKIGSYFR